MAKRQRLVLVLAGVFSSFGASYRTPNGNFVVEAATPQVAERVGQWAEYYRKEKALEWLGREMPPWSEPCPLHIKITTGSAGGATEFNFMHGQVWQNMRIEGALDRMVASVLPHEVTHTVFAHYFRCPVPRWADEGGAVLSEDDLERSHHDQLVRQILNAGRAIPLRRLFTLREYQEAPVEALYAEGYSVSNFLVASSNRRAFLAFVAQGMQGDWDGAVQAHYHYQTVEQLEEAWLAYLRSTKRQPPTILAQNSVPHAEPANRVIVRLTAPPVQPLQDMPLPIIRAQSPDPEAGESWALPTGRAASRPGYLPNYDPNPNAPSPPAAAPNPIAVPHDPWQPPGARLGTPQFAPLNAVPGRGNPAAASPVGYPN
jgi:hypothetical protein